MNENQMDFKTLPVIVTRKRLNDWQVHQEYEPAKWEAGQTEAEAIGKLYISHPDLFGTIQRVSA